MADDLKSIANAAYPVLIDFYADWCGPCITLHPILEEVKESFGDKLNLLRVDVDDNKALAVNFKIKSVPTLMLFKNGKQLWRHSGLISKADLSEVIENYQTD